MAISGRHFQFVQGVDKNAPTDCVCSGGHCAAVGGFAALRMGVPFTGGERHWQLQIPAHSADRTGSRIVIARALCARGNLGKAVTFSPEVPNYPAKYCEIPTSLRSSE